ncbi:hypothetical protein LSPH24S_00963 [Lysinibacillus sphaericus]
MKQSKLIEEVTQIATLKAIEVFNDQKEQAIQKEQSKRLHNTKLLLKHYQEFKLYVEKIDEDVKVSIPRGLFIMHKKGCDTMLKSCAYCGGIHKHGQRCPSKPIATKKTTHIDRFRWSRAWKNKRAYIADRDKHLCQVCLRNLHNTQTQYNFTELRGAS